MPKGLLKIHGEEIWNFLTTFSGYKELWYKLKAQVKQIKTQSWPFKNCWLLPEISSFIHRDDFWSIAKLVAYARQPLKTGRCSMVLLVFLVRLKVSRKSSMQYWLVGLENAHVYTFSLLRVAYQTLSSLCSLWACSGTNHSNSKCDITSVSSAVSAAFYK